MGLTLHKKVFCIFTNFLYTNNRVAAILDLQPISRKSLDNVARLLQLVPTIELIKYSFVPDHQHGRRASHEELSTAGLVRNYWTSFYKGTLSCNILHVNYHHQNIYQQGRRKKKGKGGRPFSKGTFTDNRNAFFFVGLWTLVSVCNQCMQSIFCAVLHDISEMHNNW